MKPKIEAEVPRSYEVIKSGSRQKIKNKDVEKQEPSYIAGGNVKWYNYFKKQFVSSSKC